MKIVEKQYIDDFMESKIHFSNCNVFIQNGKISGNKGRGDTLEGIFARTSINNIKLNEYIQHYNSIFGNDLGIEKDGQYINFFRKSTREMSISCFYSVDTKILTNNFYHKYPGGIYPNDKEPKMIPNEEKGIIYNFPIIIDDRYLSDYSAYEQNREVVMVQPFNIISELKKLGFLYDKVRYIDMSQEFNIFDYCFKSLNKPIYNSISERMDLLFKDIKYQHENEYRFICPNPNNLLDSNNNIILNKLVPLNMKEKYIVNCNNYDIFVNTKNLDWYMDVKGSFESKERGY